MKNFVALSNLLEEVRALAEQKELGSRLAIVVIDQTGRQATHLGKLRPSSRLAEAARGQAKAALAANNSVLEGITSMAAAGLIVKDGRGRTVGAIGLAGPSWQASHQLGLEAISRWAQREAPAVDLRLLGGGSSREPDDDFVQLPPWRL